MADTGTSNALKPVSQLKTASDLSRKMDSLRKARQRKERDWRLNVAFYRGNQYCEWNSALNGGRGGIQNIPTEDGEKPRYLVRIVANQIVLGVQSIVSKILKTKPIWSATPGQAGDKAVKASELAEDLLEYWWKTKHLGGKYQEAVIWSLLADNGYLKATWDPYAASEMRFLLGPDGQPIVDQTLADEFRAQLGQKGIQPQETVAYMGDIKVEAMSPFDVFGDDTAQSAEDWKWVFCRHWMTPDQIKTRWKVDVKADAVPCSPDTALPVSNSESSHDPTVKAVWIGYFLPTPEMPNGRYVVFVEDPDKILADEKWPYPIRDLGVFQIQGIRVPGGAENDAIVTHIRPLQKQLNRLLSQVVMYTNLTVKPRIWAPVNSLRQRLTTEPGAVFEYTPVGNQRPEIEQLPAIPAYVFEFLNDLGGRIRELFGLTEVTEGSLPPNLEAANAIDLLQEMATDRFAPAIEANERALARMGQFMLALAQEYYDEKRMLTLAGFGGATSVREFSKADIAGNISVSVEAGSSMPRSRAARRQQIEKWIEMQIITPQQAWKYYDIADVKDLAMQFRQDEDHALREHDKMIAGIPINPESMQQAMGALQQGMNPETGQPLQPNDNPQDILKRASLSPYLAENLQVHLDVHKRTIVSLEFDSMDPEVRDRFLTHYSMTLDKLMQLPATAPPDAPKVTLSLKGDVGAATTAAVLKRGGVPEADAQTLANEPPLVTAVYDSVDKPDADSGSPGEEANNLSQVAQMMVMTDIANSKAQQDAAHKDVHHTLDATQKNQSQAQADELHAHAVRKAKAEADLAEKKAKESSFTPKPKPAAKGK